MRQACSQLDDALSGAAAMIDAALRRRFNDIGAPSPLGEAMSYAVLAGGKRLRPFLLIECAGMFGVKPEAALPTALALECLHTYSLIHDDLPAMDDDDLRRGQPTVHKVYDEATAILAGDGLLTLAFQILAEPETHADGGIRARLVGGLARAAGACGMVGGQTLDLVYESQNPDAAAIAAMQMMKTGALFQFACWAGGTLARARERDILALETYAEAFGRAFQITDDLLDTEGDTKIMGKSVGKDSARSKATLDGSHGPETARSEAGRLVAHAETALKPFGGSAQNLVALAWHLLERRN